MVNNNELILVRNMTDQIIVYNIPEFHIKRRFAAFESKNIAAKELRDLYFLAGGARILQCYLCVTNEELAAEFGVSKDMFTHEYSWTKKDIDDTLMNGSIDLLADAFDFAPVGICETLVSEAIRLRIPDRNKHRLIESVTGRDIAQMIEFDEKLDQLKQDNSSTQTGERRVGNNKDKIINTGRRVR